MTTQRELDNLLDAFFEEGPVQVADRVIDGALVQIDKNERRRTFNAPRRLQAMNIFRGLATAAVIGVLLVGALAYLSRPELPPVGATATPGLPSGSGDPAVVGPSPTNPGVAITAPPSASPNPTSSSAGTALIAYVRLTDKPKDTSFRCRFIEGPTCPVNRLWLVGVDGTGAHELFPEGVTHQDFLGWSADGNHLMYRDGDGLSYLTDTSGSDPQVLETGCAQPCYGDNGLALSRDGTALLFVRSTVEANRDISHIAILSLASGQVVELSSTAPKGGSLPGWSPDGRQIVFTRFGRKETDGPFQPFNSAIFVVDADGQNLRQISPATLDAENGRWSPDGSRILFTSPNGDGADIYTMNADGSDVQRLTSDGVSMSASWTPDGRILFIRDDSGADPLGFWTMDGDGRNAAEVVPGTVTGAHGFDPEMFSPATVPLWQPIGGQAIVPPPWHPSTATLVGPPAPTSVATPMPELAAGFSRTGSLAASESGNPIETATRLQDGRVLVTRECSPVAALYDPQTGKFSATGHVSAARRFATATLLQDGRVLIAGGRDDCSGADRIFTSAEIYDPQTGAFTATGSMGVSRQFHAAALLADGRVLIAGGITDEVASSPTGIVLAATASNVVKSAEIYDPTTGTFSPTGSMINFRDRFTATTLNDGSVLVLGGGGEGYAARTAAELYDPASGTFSRTGSMARPRWLHTATLLGDGRVLIAGGRAPNDRALASTEVYDPGSGEFSTVGPMTAARQQHTATLLQDGRVLVTGGYSYDGNNWDVLSSTEIFDPDSMEFTSTGSMGEARWSSVAALLDDGRVLIAGGTGVGIEDLVQLTSAVLYQP